MGLGPTLVATITVGTTATAIGSGPLLCQQAYIEADLGNSGTVKVGDSTLTTALFMTVLANTAATNKIWLPNAPVVGANRPDHGNLDVNKVYLLGSAAGQVVHVTYFERLGGKT